MAADIPNQLALFDPPATLTPEEATIAREALSYTIAMLSRGCPYAPEWTDEQVVEMAGPLLQRLKAGR